MLPQGRGKPGAGKHPGNPASKHLLVPRAEPQPPWREKAAEERSHAPCKRKQMLPTQPRHFPSLSGGAERAAGSRGCGITSCPSPVSLRHPAYFIQEQSGEGGQSEQDPALSDNSQPSLT